MALAMSIIVVFMSASALVQANQEPSGGECPSVGKPQNAVSLLQMNVESANDGGTGGHIKPNSKLAEGSIKLIVNSDVRYSDPLDTLFESMEKASFQRWNDVVVMRGSASQDTDPFIPDTAYGKKGVTYVDLKLSSFDLHGFSGLWHHHHHPRVEADVYFYIHDTVLVNSTFPSKFNTMAYTTGRNEVRHPPVPFNNICVFGSGVVDLYNGIFDHARTKRDGVSIEASGGIGQYTKDHTVLEETEMQPFQLDLWHTGYPRAVKYFPSFGLTKYMFPGFYGDLTGHVEETHYGDPEPDLLQLSVRRRL